MIKNIKVKGTEFIQIENGNWIRYLGCGSYQVIAVVFVENHTDNPFYRIESHLIHATTFEMAYEKFIRYDDYNWVEFEKQDDVSEYLAKEFYIKND